MSATIAGRAAAAGGLGAIGGVGTQALAAGAIGGAGGLLFGLSYGTAIRIGYEQIYPALFPKNKDGTQASPNLPEILTKLETLYDFIGGKAAHIFGMEQGLNAAIKAEGTPLEPAHDTEIHTGGLNFLETMDNFFRSITPLPEAFGHTVGDNNPDKFGIPDPNLANEPTDAELSALQTTKDKNAYLQKIKNYSTNDLKNLLQYVTTTSQQKRWVQELLNSPSHQSTVQKTPSANLSEQASAWNIRRDKLMTEVQQANKWANQTSSGGTLSMWKKKARDALSLLRIMSNDYRSSNNFIRTQALLLRKFISEGHIKVTTRTL